VPHAAELVRVAAALVFSGIFWGTVLFLVNACALNRHVPFIGVGAAVGLLLLTALLLFGIGGLNQASPADVTSMASAGDDGILTSWEFARFAVALFYSGIFWMMSWFVLENGGIRRSQRPGMLPLALVLMVGSAYLILGVVAHQQLFAMPIEPPP
jgi:hypothetical protein